MVSKKGIKTLKDLARSVNFVWNFCVETQKTCKSRYLRGENQNWLSQFSLQKLTSGTSKDLGLHGQTIQEICREFVKGRDSHKKCPKFRSCKKSLGWVPFQEQSRRAYGNRVTYLGKTYKFFGAKRRPLPENGVKGGCFVEDSRGRWYVCFWAEATKLPTGKGQVGIDLGLKDLAVLSNGEKITNPTIYRKLEGKLKVASRSHNKKRLKAILAKIKNSRKDYLHKESTKLANANRLIVVGNVNSSNLIKGKMAKSIYDVSWYSFKRMLEYKASRHQAIFKVVNEAFTTQTCSTCGSLPESRPKGIAGLGIRSWVCSDCGASHDRDVNAARNILMIGLSAQPPAEESLVANRRSTTFQYVTND